MRWNLSRLRRNAFSLIEMVVTLGIFLLLISFLLPGWARAKQRSSRIYCSNNLMQIGVASRTWALSHTNTYPANVRAVFGGAQEEAEAGNPFRCFQVMSNELSTPWILICPADSRPRATNFATGFSNTNLSYFIGLESDVSQPQMFLAGDRNLTNGGLTKFGVLELTSNNLVGWSHTMHHLQGNVALADGSVQQFSSSRLQDSVRGSSFTNRLAMP